MTDNLRFIAYYVSCLMIFGIIVFTILIIMLNNENRYLLMRLQEPGQTLNRDMIQEKTDGLWGAIGLNILTLVGISYYFNKYE